MNTVVDTLEQLRPLVGTQLGVSDWVAVDQKRIDIFARRPATTSGSTSIPRAPNGPFGGTRLRTRASLAALDEFPGGAQLTVDAVVERERGDKPVCVAQPIFRYHT